MPCHGLRATDQLQKLILSLRKGCPFIPKGVFRFQTFEEAQKWSLEMITRKSPGHRR